MLRFVRVVRRLDWLQTAHIDPLRRQRQFALRQPKARLPGHYKIHDPGRHIGIFGQHLHAVDDLLGVGKFSP